MSMPPQAVPLDDHEAMDDEFEIHEDGHGDGPGNPQEDELMSDVGELVDAASALDEIGAEVEGPGEGGHRPPPELPEPAAGSAAQELHGPWAKLIKKHCVLHMLGICCRLKGTRIEHQKRFTIFAKVRGSNTRNCLLFFLPGARVKPHRTINKTNKKRSIFFF